MRSFDELVSDYRSLGASSLKEELHEILKAAQDPRAKKGLMYFASDVCLDLEKWEESRNILNTIEARFEVDDVHYNNIALCLWSLGDRKSALKHYRKSILLNPDNSSSVRGAAVLLVELGKDDQAKVFAQRWRELRPDDQEASKFCENLKLNYTEPSGLTNRSQHGRRDC
jgi:tetratricopeptide (TPR) repeat protein